MPDARREDRSLHQRPDDVGQQQVGHRFELVALTAGCPVMRTPSSRKCCIARHTSDRDRAQLLGDARAADDQRRIVAQQANDVAQAGVGQAFRQRRCAASCAGVVR